MIYVYLSSLEVDLLMSKHTTEVLSSSSSTGISIYYEFISYLYLKHMQGPLSSNREQTQPVLFVNMLDMLENT